MTDTTDNLQLPWLAAAQAQKHVTVNSALQTLDAVVQLAVASRSLPAPPSAPGPGERHIVAAGAVGAWAGRAGQVAAFQDAVWCFYAPVEGWSAWVADEHAACIFTEGAWTAAAVGAGAPVWGVNTSADTHNRLAVSSEAALLTHDGGDHRLTVNKAAADATASVIFADGFSGRAEVGLAGDDDLVVKVSADGSTWREALRVAASDGSVSAPAGAWPGRPNLLINGDFRVNQRGFAGGALAAGGYGLDRWKAGAGGCACSVSGGVVTLGSGALVQVVEPAMWSLDDLAGAVLTVTVEGLEGGLTVQAGSTAASLTPAAPSARLTLAQGDHGAFAVQLSPASGPSKLRRVKLEVGAPASPWALRSAPEELRLCQRYFETSAPPGASPASYAPGAGNGAVYAGADSYTGCVVPVRFGAPKRAVPQVVIRDGTARTGCVSGYMETNGWADGYPITIVQGLSLNGFSMQQNNSRVLDVSFDWTADAEL